jgi:hypothetical protein
MKVSYTNEVGLQTVTEPKIGQVLTFSIQLRHQPLNSLVELVDVLPVLPLTSYTDCSFAPAAIAPLQTQKGPPHREGETGQSVPILGGDGAERLGARRSTPSTPRRRHGFRSSCGMSRSTGVRLRALSGGIQEHDCR